MRTNESACLATQVTQRVISVALDKEMPRTSRAGRISVVKEQGKQKRPRPRQTRRPRPIGPEHLSCQGRGGCGYLMSDLEPGPTLLSSAHGWSEPLELLPQVG